MFKKIMLIGMAVAAMAAMAASAASAAPTWYDNGVALKAGENPHIVAEGTAQFTGPLGTVHCSEVTSTVELTGGTDQGLVLTFEADKPTTLCKVTAGTIKALCGEKSLEVAETLKVNGVPKATVTEKGVAGATTDDLDITNVELFNKFVNPSGTTCLEVTFKNSGNITATPDNASAIKTLTLAGTLTSGSNSVTVSGDLKVTPEGTYGITP